MAVALIGYRGLGDAQKAKIQEVLKKHPHFGEYLSAQRPADAAPDEWVVMRAAVWPDWVRENHKGEQFSKPLDHYANLPISRLEGANPDQVKEINDNIAKLSTNPESGGNILKALPQRVEQVSAAGTAPEDRAIALCWVLHLVGDLHQPLHAAALFTKDSPKGDEGGNAFYTRWNGRSQNLHFVWDGVLGWDEFAGPSLTEYGVVDLMVRDFQHRYQIAAAERAVTKFETWADESRDLADKEAYSSNGTPIPVVLVFDRHVHPKGAQMAPLPPGYAKRAKEVAEKRVLVGGTRLIDQLKAIIPASNGGGAGR
jgi:hypothetical protein